MVTKKPEQEWETCVKELYGLEGQTDEMHR